MSGGRGMARWVLLVVALAACAWVLYWYIDRTGDAGPSLEFNEILLPALSIALVVVSLGLAGIIIRNLVRLIVDRKRGILGARLRTKLVFFFLGLVLLPSMILFYGSVAVIKTTVEALLRAPMEDLNRQSSEMVDRWNDYFRELGLRTAEELASEILATGHLAEQRRAELEHLLGRWRQQHGLEIVRVGSPDLVLAEARRAVENREATLSGEIGQLLDSLVSDAVAEQRSIARLSHLGEGLLAQAAIPLRSGVQTLGADSGLAVAVGIVLPTRLTGNLEGLAEASQAYRQFRVKRNLLVRLYLTQVALVFLVTVFIATWIGFYLARRITVPLQQLAMAAREISAGNLQVRVKAKAGDEVGLLIEAFNEMAGELEENRAVITRSTSDLRQTNLALDERRRYIETLLAGLSTAVLSLDPHGKVTTANPAVRRLLGISVKPGDDLKEIFQERELLPLRDLLAKGIDQGEEGLNKDLTLRIGGATMHVAVQVSELKGGGGETVGTLLMLEDLTDLSRAQRSAAWREVAQRIAHEIKNPLTPIQLAAQRLGKKYKASPAELERVLPEATASIEREVGNLKQLVDEFSRFARMPEISLKSVQFDEIVQSVLALYEGSTEIEWSLDLDPEIGEVTLDPQQMRRVLINLIDNAVAALEGRGRIRIAAHKDRSGLLSIEIADWGPGIPPEARDSMFVPYFSTKERGSGLGLAIVERVITDHRGTIRVEDNDPSGARFIIEIPA